MKRLFALVLIGLVIGWIMNIIQLFGMVNTSLNNLTLMIILKIVGIFFAPLGGILGWI
jgi:flagellar biosynthesis protein FliQ